MSRNLPMCIRRYDIKTRQICHPDFSFQFELKSGKHTSLRGWRDTGFDNSSAHSVAALLSVRDNALLFIWGQIGAAISRQT